MLEERLKESGATNGSARRLALPLAAVCLLGAGGLASCGSGEAVGWVGVQDCAVGIPPEAMRGVPLGSAQLPLVEAQVTPLGSGFYIRNFTLGPIAEFSCEAPQVTARFVAAGAPAAGSLQPLGAAPGPGRPIELDPFDCVGSDGRSYRLDGAGQADQDALFFNQTFTAWLGADRATLVCSTRFQRQTGAVTAADAGTSTETAPLEPESFGPAVLDGPEPTAPVAE